MYHYNPKKRQMIKIFAFAVALVCTVSYVVLSSTFERENPKITLLHSPYWNLTTPIDINISDNVSLSDYRVLLRYGDDEILLAEGKLENQKEFMITLRDLNIKNQPIDHAELIIEATDASLWNFFYGNAAKETIALTIDRINPSMTVVANSYGIALGGSALVVFEAYDEHIDKIKVTTKSGREFVAAKFYKDNFYIALIARGINEKEFIAYIYANDHAGNQTRVRIPFYLKEIGRYRQPNVKLTKNFLDGKIDDLNFRYNQNTNDKNMSAIERFIFVNETLRNKSLKTIEEHTRPSTLPPINSFEIDAFSPLPHSKMVAGFGEHRTYTYDSNKVGESYHLGIDLASVKEAAVFVSNEGVTVYSDDNGVYGNMPIIHHGLGLFTIYGHCTQLFIAQNDLAVKGKQVGTTGISGLALGDHTHFETRVQGVAVTPIEWMDSAWIKANIIKVQEDARKVIDGRAR
jgi:murein DD-endopeptidase MepM/ murein hydrolase activator NlpD